LPAGFLGLLGEAVACFSHPVVLDASARRRGSQQGSDGDADRADREWLLAHYPLITAASALDLTLSYVSAARHRFARRLRSFRDRSRDARQRVARRLRRSRDR